MPSPSNDQPKGRPGVSGSDRGPKNPLLTEKDRLNIIRRVEAGETQASLAREYDVTRQYVSILMGRAKKRGVESAATIGKKGRPAIRTLTKEEEKKIHDIIKAHKRPNDAGFRIRTKAKNVWDIDSVKKLIHREFLFSPGRGNLLDLLAKWGIAVGKPKGTKKPRFSKSYYDYIKSDIGKEVIRKSDELRKADEERRRKEAEAEKKRLQDPADGHDEDTEMWDEAEMEKIRKQVEAGKSPYPSAAPPAPNQRMGKHSKGRMQKKKKRKKKK